MFSDLVNNHKRTKLDAGTFNVVKDLENTKFKPLFNFKPSGVGSEVGVYKLFDSKLGTKFNKITKGNDTYKKSGGNYIGKRYNVRNL